MYSNVGHSLCYGTSVKIIFEWPHFLLLPRFLQVGIFLRSSRRFFRVSFVLGQTLSSKHYKSAFCNNDFRFQKDCNFVVSGERHREEEVFCCSSWKFLHYCATEQRFLWISWEKMVFFVTTAPITSVTALSIQMLLEQKRVGWSTTRQLYNSMFENGQTLQSFTAEGTFVDR